MPDRSKRSPSSAFGTRYMNSKDRKNMRNKLYAEQLGICAICGTEIDPTEATLDHIVPVGDGGKNRKANLQVTHRLCNMRRQKKCLEKP